MTVYDLIHTFDKSVFSYELDDCINDVYLYDANIRTLEHDYGDYEINEYSYDAKTRTLAITV